MIDNINNGKEKVWVPDTDKGWIEGELLKQTNEGSWLVKDENGKEITIEKDELRIQNPIIQEGIDDMTNLSHLHEAAVIHNLIKRYELNSIYTYTGSILIAINPYSRLPIYTKEMIESFCDQPVNKLAPHVYSIAECSYREMLTFQKNQSILVSGESGAGKTETTKFLLQYFAAMGEKGNGVNTSLVSDEDIQEGNNIETQVIKSTPILEAFGNAKTLRNDNSSRFGKFIEIHFHKLKGTIIGAKLETYLLEKSRIVKPPDNERSYHIFYQMLAGIGNGDGNAENEQQIKELQISNQPKQFNYLIQSGCTSIDGVDDKDVFLKTEKALKVIGFTNDELFGIYKILSAILHIGNIEFKQGTEEDSSIVEESSSFGSGLCENYNPLEVACKLLGCSVDTLKSTFTSRKMKAGNESYTINHTTIQASQARDSLSMFLYSRLFDWLVLRINQSIDKVGGDNKSPDSSYLFIGILDIYGFESFESNSYEQFTINYANEKLQNQFNHQIFKLEQLEYEKEKIDWSYIDFSDNQDCIDLIEKKPLGILSILDEESQFPKSTPSTLCTKLYSNHTKSKHFEKPRFSQTHFIIDHYAGKVSYDTNLFLEKNKDFIISEQVSALESSSWEFITSLLQNLAKKMSGGSGNKSGGGAVKSTFKFTSVSSQFKESLNLLMTTINNTNPHYIRCIKPNNEKKPNSFENVMVLHQLRCSGVIEQLRISRSGYPSRLLYDNFIKRYKLIVAKEFKDSKEWTSIIKSEEGNSEHCKKAAESMMDKLSIEVGNVQFGLTKLFFKSGIIANLELKRSQTLINSAIYIQKIWKGYYYRKQYLEKLNSSIGLQSLVRMYLTQLEYNILVEEDAAIHLQSLIRANEQQLEFNLLMDSATHLQTLLRGLLDSREYFEIRKRIYQITIIQSKWRQKQAYKQFKLLRAEAKSLTNVVAEKEKLASRLKSEADEKEKLASKLKSEADEKEKLTSKLKSEADEKEKLKLDIGNIGLEKEELLLKLSNVQKEFETYKKQSELTINNLNQQIESLKSSNESRKHVDKDVDSSANTTGSAKFTSPPRSITNSPNVSAIEPINQDDYYEDGLEDIILSPKQHKRERNDREVYQLSRQPLDNNEDVVPKGEFKQLESQYNQLIEKDITHQKYIESLKDQIVKLEDQLKRSASHPRSLLPGIPTNINDSPTHTNVIKSSYVVNDYKSPLNISPSTTSPLNSSTVKSLSYKDFTNSQEIIEQQQLQQQQQQLNNNPLNQSSPTGSDKSSSVPSSSISDLVSALNFNNCQLESGKYLVDLILVNHESVVSNYVPSEMGGIPEPAFILSRCFLSNIYDLDIYTPSDNSSVPSSIETNVNILIYFCDRVDNLVFSNPKSNCTSLCFWFSNFYTLFNIMEAYNSNVFGSEIEDNNTNIISVKETTNNNDSILTVSDKSFIEKLKITIQTMIVKAHKGVVKNITDYIQPILHKSLNDTSSEIDFMDPITNYLNQIQISLNLDTCFINNNICKLLFEQLFSFINAMIFNEILLRKDLCCLRSSIPIKMNISELEHWVKSHHGKEWSASVCDKLKLLKEVVYILMIDKTQLQNATLRNEICPTLSIAQLKQLLTMYSPDVDSFEDPIPLECLTSLMNCSSYNPNENILLDLSKIFTLKFINSNHQLSSSACSLQHLMSTINIPALESIQYSCDDLVSNVVKNLLLKKKNNP